MVTEIVDLDLGTNSSFKIMTMQGDVASRFIEFHLTYNNEVFDLTGKTVSCRYLKDDKTVNTTNLVINDKLNGVCTLDIPYELMENPYIAKSELVIKQSNEILSTIPFTVEVVKSLVKSSVVESTSEFGALNDALWKIDGVDSRIKGLSSQLDNKANKNSVSNVQQQINNLVLGAVGDGNNAEVVQARGDYLGNTFDTLKSKDDNIEKLLFEKTSIFNNIKFEQGGTGSNGDYASNNRLRSNIFIINGVFDIEIDSAWKYNLLEYDTKDTLIKNYGFTSEKSTIDGTKGTKFKIVLGKNDNVTITPNSSEGVLSIQYSPNFGIFSDLNQIRILKDSLTDKKLEFSKTKNGYYQQNNFVDSYANITYYYDVKGLNFINLTTTQTQYKNIYTLLDDSYNVLNYIRVNDASLTLNNEEIQLGGASYIAISEPKNNPVENKKITYLTAVTKNEPTGENFGKWYRKKLVWFGTSIPAGAKEGKDNPLSYPMKLGERLGATVINEAVGESSLHCKAIHRISENNPYGFEENWNKCARCLTNTLEEVEWLLANYNNTTVFTTGTLTALTEDDKAFYRRCSYENKLLPHLNSGNVDLFVLDHGHNDRYNANKKDGSYVDDSVVMQEYGEFNLYTFEGASNFIINKILTANPKNRICFIGEYENQKLPLVSQFQSKVADKWCYPIYKQWERLGWTQNKIFTTGYWNNSTGLWIESGGEEQQITMLNRWVRDNIHPSSDNSGKATEWLLENMEVWFSNNL